MNGQGLSGNGEKAETNVRPTSASLIAGIRSVQPES